MSSPTRQSTIYSYTTDTLPSNEYKFNAAQNLDTNPHSNTETPKTGFNFRDSFIAGQLEMRKAEDNQVQSETPAKKPQEQTIKDLEIITRLKMGLNSAKSLFSKLSAKKLAGAAMMIGLAFGNVDMKENTAFAAGGESVKVKTESVETLKINTEGNISLTQIAKDNNLTSKITGSNDQIQKFYDQGVFTRTGDRNGGTVTVNLDMLKKVLGEKSNSTQSQTKTETPVKVGDQTKKETTKPLAETVKPPAQEPNIQAKDSKNQTANKSGEIITCKIISKY